MIFNWLNNLLLLAVLLPVAVIDHRSRRIPNRALLWLTGLRALLYAAEAAGALLSGTGLSAVGHAAACAVGMAGFLLMVMAAAHHLSPAGLGMGDVKLCGALGFCLPLFEALSVLVIAFFLSAVLGAGQLLRRRIGRADPEAAFGRIELAFAPQVLVALIIRIAVLILIRT